MQNIRDYILEKLKLSVNTNTKQQTIKPKNRDELKQIISERLKKRDYVDKKIVPVDLNDIDVSGIKDFSDVFKGYDLTDVDMSGWNTHNANSFDHMFMDATGMYNLDISNWDVSNVHIMHSTFANTDFNGNISEWDVSNVLYFNSMFKSNPYFDGDISKWDVSNASEMAGMFWNATVFTGKGLDNWNTGNVKTMNIMFKNCSNLDVDLSSWVTRKVNNHEDMFEGTNIPKEKQPIFKN